MGLLSDIISNAVTDAVVSAGVDLVLGRDTDLKGKTEEQQNVIRYFTEEDGCFKKRSVSDSMFDEIVSDQVKRVDFYQNAINKLNLDEDEFKEVKPIKFEATPFKFSALHYYGKDGVMRSSNREFTYIFITEEQILVYSYMMNFNNNERKEVAKEFFLKDVINIETVDTTEKVSVWGGTTEKRVVTELLIKMKDENYSCTIKSNDSETADGVKALKAKLREYKTRA